VHVDIESQRDSDASENNLLERDERKVKKNPLIMRSFFVSGSEK
jgi:hypothetical protein